MDPRGGSDRDGEVASEPGSQEGVADIWRSSFKQVVLVRGRLRGSGRNEGSQSMARHGS